METFSCDLTNRAAIWDLPDAPNVIFLVGQKFGTREAPDTTWFVNTVVPALVAERFTKSRIVALSTGCVYPLVAIDGPGSTEGEPWGRRRFSSLPRVVHLSGITFSA